GDGKIECDAGPAKRDQRRIECAGGKGESTAGCGAEAHARYLRRGRSGSAASGGTPTASEPVRFAVQKDAVATGRAGAGDQRDAQQPGKRADGAERRNCEESRSTGGVGAEGRRELFRVRYNERQGIQARRAAERSVAQGQCEAPVRRPDAGGG